MGQHVHVATVLVLTIACVLATWTRVVSASRKQVSLLQIKKTSPSAHWACTLPEGGTWAEVRLKGLPAFTMAVRMDDDPLSKEIREQGHWELEDASLFGAPGQALDIGGNIGYYSFALAHAGWNVTTFEPMHSNVAFIEATLCQNPDFASRVKLMQMGLGTKNQVCKMIAPPNNVGNGMVRCKEDKNQGSNSFVNFDEASYDNKGAFQIRRLDEVLQEESMSEVDFVKMDIEGYECEALRGAGDFLKTYHPRLVKSEVWQSMERCSCMEFFSMFQDADYRIAKDDDPACSESLTAEEQLAWGGNFYMCH